jgi:branched-subunit amino acid ABC-type transport system permease component
MVISATFIIGAALAAVAGMMWAANYGTVQHSMGFLPGLKAFTAAVLGGIGNLAGAVVGGMLLGWSRPSAPATWARSPAACSAATTRTSSPSWR